MRIFLPNSSSLTLLLQNLFVGHKGASAFFGINELAVFVQHDQFTLIVQVQFHLLAKQREKALLLNRLDAVAPADGLGFDIGFLETDLNFTDLTGRIRPLLLQLLHGYSLSL